MFELLGIRHAGVAAELLRRFEEVSGIAALDDLLDEKRVRNSSRASDARPGTLTVRRTRPAFFDRIELFQPARRGRWRTGTSPRDRSVSAAAGTGRHRPRAVGHPNGVDPGARRRV